MFAGAGRAPAETVWAGALIGSLADCGFLARLLATWCSRWLQPSRIPVRLESKRTKALAWRRRTGKASEAEGGWQEAAS